MAALPDAIKVFIVQALACFDTISRTAKAVREEFGVEVSPQQCERYDPTKRAGVVDAINDMLGGAKDLSVWERLAG
ncbi:DUF2280 domain-containing protein [Burkholderia vietnamiensis]|uniref:DUF2280 domain-containing protein n=1 Tax=Burkholderia vietnamiensis TaxID=60552 RepID=UPI001FC7EDCA|nr:DUF2280 domain-containing protein [Burkholderia vietnamiensis]